VAAFSGSPPVALAGRSGPSRDQLGLVTFKGSDPGAVQAIAGAASNPAW